MGWGSKLDPWAHSLQLLGARPGPPIVTGPPALPWPQCPPSQF